MIQVSTIGKYILVDKKPVEEPDLIVWGFWMEYNNTTVNLTHIQDVTVSTSFRGLDFGRTGNPPLLFETIIFGGEYDFFISRYATWEEAEDGHQRACELVCGV